MSLERLLHKKVLVSTARNSVYIGQLDAVSGSNILLSSAYKLISNKLNLMAFVASSGTFSGKVSTRVDSILVSGGDRIMSLSDSAYLKLSSLQTIEDSTVLPFTKIDFKSINGYDVVNINGCACVVYQVHGRASMGALILNDMTLTPRRFITFGSTTAIGKDLHEAYENAKSQILNYEGKAHDKIDYATLVYERYPDIDAKVPVIELCELHNFITGSCTSGIREFLLSHNVNLNGTASMREFLYIVKDAYAPDKISKIAEKYGIKLN